MKADIESAIKYLEARIIVMHECYEMNKELIKINETTIKRLNGLLNMPIVCLSEIERKFVYGEQ